MSSPTPYAPQQDFDVGSLYAGIYLKTDDLGGRTYMAIIAGVERVEIAEQNGAVRPKAAVQMQGWPAKLLLNKVNFETIAGAYGRQSAGWLGKPLEVYPDTTLFGGRSVPCIRVRVPRPAATAGPIPGGALPATSPVAPAAPAVPVTAAVTLPPLMTTTDFENDVPY